MKLLDLEPQFLRHELRVETRRFTRPDGGVEERTGPCECHIDVDTLTDAQGVLFLCPKCFAQNNGPVGTHSVLCWFRDRGVPPEAVPGPARWAASGTSYANLTLQPSVLLSGNCAWHGFITSGVIVTC